MEIAADIRERIKAASAVVVLTGAGVSAESGIPTFRGQGGYWKNYRPEDLATPQAFARNPGLVWEWYDMRRSLIAKARPNAAHQAIAKLESMVRDFTLVTQNIDGLHRRAGSEHILEIHGNIWQARCTECPCVFSEPRDPLPLPDLPVCPDCGGLARPYVVWFGESYDSELMVAAQDAIFRADLLLVAGTSGMVSMPVFLTRLARDNGALVFEFNLEPSELTPLAHHLFAGPAGETVPNFVEYFS